MQKTKTAKSNICYFHFSCSALVYYRKEKNIKVIKKRKRKSELLLVWFHFKCNCLKISNNYLCSSMGNYFSCINLIFFSHMFDALCCNIYFSNLLITERFYLHSAEEKTVRIVFHLQAFNLWVLSQ